MTKQEMLGKAYANWVKADAEVEKADAYMDKAIAEIKRIKALPDDYEE